MIQFHQSFFFIPNGWAIRRMIDSNQVLTDNRPFQSKIYNQWLVQYLSFGMIKSLEMFLCHFRNGKWFVTNATFNSITDQNMEVSLMTVFALKYSVWPANGKSLIFHCWLVDPVQLQWHRLNLLWYHQRTFSKLFYSVFSAFRLGLSQGDGDVIIPTIP